MPSLHTQIEAAFTEALALHPDLAMWNLCNVPGREWDEIRSKEDVELSELQQVLLDMRETGGPHPWYTTTEADIKWIMAYKGCTEDVARKFGNVLDTSQLEGESEGDLTAQQLAYAKILLGECVHCSATKVVFALDDAVVACLSERARTFMSEHKLDLLELDADSPANVVSDLLMCTALVRDVLFWGACPIEP